MNYGGDDLKPSRAPCQWSIPRPIDSSLHEAGQPATRVRHTAVLHIEQQLTDRGGHRADPIVDPWIADDDLTTVTRQPTDRRDDRWGTAGEPLGDLATGRAITLLVDGDTAYLHREAEIAGQRKDRGARHALQDRPGQLGGHDGA